MEFVVHPATEVEEKENKVFFWRERFLWVRLSWCPPAGGSPII